MRYPQIASERPQKPHRASVRPQVSPGIQRHQGPARSLAGAIRPALEARIPHLHSHPQKEKEPKRKMLLLLLLAHPEIIPETPEVVPCSWLTPGPILVESDNARECADSGVARAHPMRGSHSSRSPELHAEKEATEGRRGRPPWSGSLTIWSSAASVASPLQRRVRRPQVNSCWVCGARVR